MNKLIKAGILVFVILLLDQILKIWIKTNMFIGQEYHIAGDWFIIHFTENNGMAFGFELGGEFGKIALSIFRIVAVGFIGYYIYKLSKTKVATGYVLSIAGIFAGAMGNILDSAFYGMIFNRSYYLTVSDVFPKEGGYAPFLYGKVVDMFYFPLINGHFPDWFPFWAGEEFLFFRPVFNVADASITVSVIVIILFYRSYLKR
jgi:signal peptidase II